MSGSSARRTSGNAFLLLFGTIIKMASGLVLARATAYLGVTGFAKYNLVVHIFELFLSLAATAAAILLTRDAARWPRHQNELFCAAAVLVLVLFLPCPGLMWFVGHQLGYSAETIQGITWASIGLIPASLSVLFEALFVARQRAEFGAIGTMIESLLRVIVSCVIVYWGFGLLPLVWVLLGSRLIQWSFYLVCWNAMGNLRWQFSPRRWVRYASRWRMFAAENWMAALYTTLDVLVVSAVAGETAAGLYMAAWKIVRLGSAVAKSYTTAVFPVMSRLIVDSPSRFHQLYRNSIRFMFAIALAAIAVVSVLPDQVILLLLRSREFLETTPVLRVLIWVLLFEFLNPFLSHLLFAQGKQHRSMHVAAISLALNLTIMVLLVRHFGAVGGAVATVCSSGVATLCYLVFAMPRAEILSIGLAVSRIPLAAILFAGLVFLIRDNWFVLASLGSASYFVLLLLVGGIYWDDLRMLKTTFLTRGSS